MDVWMLNTGPTWFNIKYFGVLQIFYPTMCECSHLVTYCFGVLWYWRYFIQVKIWFAVTDIRHSWSNIRARQKVVNTFQPLSGDHSHTHHHPDIYIKLVIDGDLCNIMRLRIFLSILILTCWDHLMIISAGLSLSHFCDHHNLYGRNSLSAICIFYFYLYKVQKTKQGNLFMEDWIANEKWPK